MEAPRCRLCGERHWSNTPCVALRPSPAPSHFAGASPTPVRETEIASDVVETVPCHAVAETPVTAPKRLGKAKAVVPADAVPDLALSADDVKKAKQREKARIGMAKFRARQRAEKQQQPAT